MEGGSKPRFGDISDETLLQMITEAGNENTWLRPRGFGLLATTEARWA